MTSSQDTGVVLKPCPTPWCTQWTKPYVFARRADILGVCCPCCNLSTDYHPTEAAAVEQWNTRTPESEMCEALDEAIDMVLEAAQCGSYSLEGFERCKSVLAKARAQNMSGPSHE